MYNTDYHRTYSVLCADTTDRKGTTIPLYVCRFSKSLGCTGTGAVRFASTTQQGETNYTSLRRATGKIEEMKRAENQPLAHDDESASEKATSIEQQQDEKVMDSGNRPPVLDTEVFVFWAAMPTFPRFRASNSVSAFLLSRG